MVLSEGVLGPNRTERRFVLGAGRGPARTVARRRPGEADERWPINILPMGDVVFGAELQTAEPVNGSTSLQPYRRTGSISSGGIPAERPDMYTCPAEECKPTTL